VPGGFVGRVAETAALRDMCRRAVRDRIPVAALVVGEPGAGKTRLLAELRTLGDIGEQIWICGYEPERDVPLACSRGLLQRLSRVPGGEAVDALAFGPDHEPTPVDAVRLFEAAHRALSSLRPTLLVVDDLHWADDASLALLHYLVRAAQTSQEVMAVVAASRKSVAAATFADSYRRVLGADHVLNVELGPLGREDGIRLARMLDPDVDEPRAGELWRTAGGSPFWLEVLATSEHGETSISTVVSERLGPAGADAVTVLALLAIAARPMPLEDVADIQRWPWARADKAAVALELRGLIRQDAGSLSVVHDLIRQAALRTISAERARRIHRRVGAWLEAVAGDDEQLLLGALEHLHRGGAPVLRAAVRLAGSPRRTLLGRAGLGRLTAILNDTEPSDPLAIVLREGVASLASELGAHEEALRRWAECSSIGDDPIAAARAALRASDAAMALTLRHEAWRHWDRARARSHLDQALVVETLAHEATLQWFLERNPTQARTAADVALAAGRALADRAGGIEALDAAVRRALLRALLAATSCALIVDDLAATLTFADELVALAAGFDERILVRALVDGALALRLQGHNVDAEARLRQAWDGARRAVLPQATLEVGAMFGNVLLSMGRVDEAEEIVRECAALGTRLVEFGPSRAFSVVLPHLVELARGDWRRAVDGLRASAAAEPDPHYRQHVHRERAAALARLDPHHGAEEVREAVAAALADAERAGCERCLIESTARAAEALARIGDPDGARSLLARIDVPPADAYNRLCRRRAEATVVAASGDEEQAIAAAEAVITEAERQGLHLDALWTRLDLGALLIRGDRNRAVEVLRDAGVRSERLGAKPEQHLAERLLRSLGVRTWRRGTAAAGDDRLASLTGRERDIARLVSDGATNPEIATAVFVSRKTVERHVSNILAKLGVRNRAELAALFADRLDASAPAD
jgi:DNA-binding NarL/FixJ family response regulator